MHPKRPSGHRPKISTMPRQRSESAHYLDIYKLTIERKRLQRELIELERRTHQVNQRLETIDAQVNTLENKAQHLRSSEQGISQDPMPTSNVYEPSRHGMNGNDATDSDRTDGVDMMTLDY
ncbi:MAG: hypothetical protein AAFY67_00180 [Cyanobacteria bacterium J06642_9]